MIGEAHAEGPGAVVNGEGALGSAHEAVVVVALEMELPSGADTEVEANAASQTGIETVVIALDEAVSVALERTGVVGHIDIAVTPLSEPVSHIATKHEVDAHILTAHRKVTHEGKLKVEVAIICAVDIGDVDILDVEVGDVVLRNEGETGTDAEPLVELIAGADFGADATVGIPGAEGKGFLNVHLVAGAAKHKAQVPATGFIIQNVALGDEVGTHIFTTALLVVVALARAATHNLLIAEVHTGGRLHTLDQVGVKEHLIFGCINQSGCHTARTGLDENAVLRKSVLRQKVGVGKGNQSRHILSGSLILSHSSAHNGEKHCDSEYFLHNIEMIFIIFKMQRYEHFLNYKDFLFVRASHAAFLTINTPSSIRHASNVNSRNLAKWKIVSTTMQVFYCVVGQLTIASIRQRERSRPTTRTRHCLNDRHSQSHHRLLRHKFTKIDNIFRLIALSKTSKYGSPQAV